MARQRQQYTRTRKLEALRRMDAAPDVQALARELGIRRELLYRWHHIYKVRGETGLRNSGRPRQNLLPLSPEAGPAAVPGSGAGGPVDALARAEARIAELERKIGRQQLEALAKLPDESAGISLSIYNQRWKFEDSVRFPPHQGGSQRVFRDVRQAGGVLARQYTGKGKARPLSCRYVTRRTSCRTVKLRIPNIRWHITFSGPRTRTVRPPWLSFSPPLTRSAVLRSP